MRQSIGRSQSFEGSTDASQSFERSVDARKSFGRSVDRSRGSSKSPDTSPDVRQPEVKPSGDSTSNLEPTLPSDKTAQNKIASEIVSALEEFLHGLAPNNIQAGPTGLHETKSGHVIDTRALGSNTLQDMDLSFEIVKVSQHESRQATAGNAGLAKTRTSNIGPVQKISKIEKPFRDSDRRGRHGYPIHRVIDLRLQDGARAYRNVDHKHRDNPEPNYIRSLVKGMGRQTKPLGQGHLDFPIPFSWQQEAKSQFRTKISDQRKMTLKERQPVTTVESLDYSVYPRDMFQNQNPSVEPQQRHLESKALVKDSLDRILEPIDHSEIKHKMAQFSREYIKPIPTRRQLQVKRGLRQTTKSRSRIFEADYIDVKPLRQTRTDTKTSSTGRLLRKHAQRKRVPIVTSFASSRRSRPNIRGPHKFSYGPTKLPPSRLFRTPKLSSSLRPRLSQRRRFSRQPLISRRQQRNPNLIRYPRQPSRGRSTESRSNELISYKTLQREVPAMRGPFRTSFRRRHKPIYRYRTRAFPFRRRDMRTPQ